MQHDAVGRKKFDMILDELCPNPVGSSRFDHVGTCRLSVVVSSDPTDDEATASAGILYCKMSNSLVDFMQEGMHLLCDVSDLSGEEICESCTKARAVTILLSRNSLESRDQLIAIYSSMTALAQRTAMCVIPVNLPGFEFPNEDHHKIKPKLLSVILENRLLEALVGQISTFVLFDFYNV